jgi:hypothetical protein
MSVDTLTGAEDRPLATELATKEATRNASIQRCYKVSKLGFRSTLSDIPIATSGNPLGEYTHINNIIGPAIVVGGSIYKYLSNQPLFIVLLCRAAARLWPGLVFAP